MVTTVIIPTYNRADVLPRAIESVLNQTVQDFELIIVDDGSTDATRSVVQRYARTDERIRYIEHETNRGVAAAQNTGIDAATGEYVTFLGSDDELKPPFLEKSVGKLETLSSCCAGVHVTLECRNDGQFEELYEAMPVLPVTESIDIEIVYVARTGGMTLRREAIEEVGPFDVRFKNIEDTDYWTRLLQRYRLVGIKEPLYIYHLHDNQKNDDPVRQTRGMRHFILKHHDVLTSKALAKSMYYLAKLYVQRGSLTVSKGFSRVGLSSRT